MQDVSRLASPSTGVLWETRRPLLPPRRASTNSTMKSTTKPPLSAAAANVNFTPPPVALTRSKSSNSPGLLSASDFALMRPPTAHTPLCRTVGISMQRSQPDSALAPEPSARSAPFRRSHSKPENPTSNIGARAIEEASHEHARKNGKKLIFMRNFSVSEEDVVVCNRVRSGVNPAFLRQQNAQDRRYLRSLSVEESRLHATRRRSNLSSMVVPEHEQLTTSQSPSHRETLPLADDDPFEMTIDPAPDARKSIASRSSSGHVLMSPRKLSSPRGRVEPVASKTPTNSGASRISNKCDVTASDSNTSTLTPREKAMHGRYLIRESFANGSYGKVCAGEALASHQEVAVKIVPKYVLISPEEKQSVIREQIIHKSLDHPHIIKLLDVFEDDGAHYFILERADNGALSTIISYSGLPESRCRDVFKQLLLALEYLHRNNIVHHDVKPHNVLLKSGSGIKLCDFGASRAFSKTETSLPFAGVFGTPGYIAPELLMGDATYGPAIDMFSAGVLLFEMVFGYAPFYPPSSCTYMPLEFPRDANVSSQVKHLLSKLLARDPAARLTASQALGHPWVTLATPGRSAPSSPVVSPRSLTTVTSMW